MYLYKKNKRFTAVNRRYARQARIRKIAIFLTFLAFAEGFLLFWLEGRDFWKDMKMPSALTWHIKQVSINAPTENLELKIENELKKHQIKLNQPFSSTDSCLLENDLRKNIEQVKSIKVQRKFFKKELLITAEKYKPFVYVLTPQDSFFVTQEGIIFQDDEEKNKEGFLNVYLNAKIESDILAKELVQFIKEIKNTSLRKTDSVFVDFEGQTARFETPFGPVKLKYFKDAKIQLSVLTEILEIAKEKDFTLPCLVDFTYFDRGKVYLKQNYKEL